MQPIVKMALLCDYALTSDDGKLSVLGIFSSMNLPGLPSPSPSFFVVVILTLEAGGHPIQLGILDPAGQQLVPDPPPIEVQVDVPGSDTNLVVHFPSLQLSRAGIYQVQLFLDGRLVHSLPLNVQAAVPAEFGSDRAN